MTQTQTLYSSFAMRRKFEVLLLSALLSAAAGCRLKPAAPVSEFALNAVTVLAGAPQRYIAERHKLEVITSESELQKSWQSAVAFCGTIQCEIVSSSITTKVGDSMPSGAIVLRVVPDDFQKLLAYVDKLGAIAQHTTEREDKTIAVVDTEAKIKNLTAFRDNLRTMLGRPSAAKVADLVEIQKQLTDTQAELDSETTQRKILANETEKIAVEISFHVERKRAGGSGFRPIWNALRESGSTLAESTASLIETILAIIPWLILIVPAAWFLRKAWKILKLRRNRPAFPPGPTHFDTR
jgi:hypothetical protein